MDDFDKKILQLLEKDGRNAFSNIAMELGISNTMVHQRVQKMMNKGIIEGIRPVLNEKKMGYDWGTFTGLTLSKDHDSAKAIEHLKQIPEVTECYYITGEYTLFVRIVAKNHENLRDILYNKIDKIPGVKSTESIIELGCAFKRSIIQ